MLEKAAQALTLLEFQAPDPRSSGRQRESCDSEAIDLPLRIHSSPLQVIVDLRWQVE